MSKRTVVSEGGPTPQEIDAFVIENRQWLNEESEEVVRSMVREDQRRVIEEGPMSNVRDPVAIVKMRAFQGKLRDDRKWIEERRDQPIEVMIEEYLQMNRHWLNDEAEEVLREMDPVDQRNVIETGSLTGCRDPVAVLRSRAKTARQKGKGKGGYSKLNSGKGKGGKSQTPPQDGAPDWQCPNSDCSFHRRFVFGRRDTCPECGSERPDDGLVNQWGGAAGGGRARREDEWDSWGQEKGGRGWGSWGDQWDPWGGKGKGKGGGWGDGYGQWDPWEDDWGKGKGKHGKGGGQWDDDDYEFEDQQPRRKETKAEKEERRAEERANNKQASEEGRCLYCSGVPGLWTPRQIQDFFSMQGDIERVHLLPASDRNTRAVFINFAGEGDALKAAEVCQNLDIEDKGQQYTLQCYVRRHGVAEKRKMPLSGARAQAEGRRLFMSVPPGLEKEQIQTLIKQYATIEDLHMLPNTGQNQACIVTTADAQQSEFLIQNLNELPLMGNVIRVSYAREKAQDQQMKKFRPAQSQEIPAPISNEGYFVLQVQNLPEWMTAEGLKLTIDGALAPLRAPDGSSMTVQGTEIRSENKADKTCVARAHFLTSESMNAALQILQGFELSPGFPLQARVVAQPTVVQQAGGYQQMVAAQAGAMPMWPGAAFGNDQDLVSAVEAQAQQAAFSAAFSAQQQAAFLSFGQ